MFDLIPQVHCTSRVQLQVHVRQLRQKWFTLKVGLHYFPRLTLVCASCAVDLASLEGLNFCFWLLVCSERCSSAQTVPDTQLYVAFKNFQARNGNGATRRGIISLKDQSRWPRGLKRGSEAAGLLGLRVHVPPESWKSVSCECRVLTGRDLCVGLIPRPEGFYRRWYVWVWAWNHDIEEALIYVGILRHKKIDVKGR